MTAFLEDFIHPVWQNHLDYPPLEYKHLERDKFEELLDLMMEAYPEHELTKWMQRGFCMNDGDATISFSSLEGRKVIQWHINHFDEEDNEFFDQWFGESDDDIDWDDEWDDEDSEESGTDD